MADLLRQFLSVEKNGSFLNAIPQLSLQLCGIDKQQYLVLLQIRFSSYSQAVAEVGICRFEILASDLQGTQAGRTWLTRWLSPKSLDRLNASLNSISARTSSP